jgi:dinuclear metal center YbgI/SA1388 family protein
MSPPISVKDVLDLLNRFAPPSLAEDWDNVGLQSGSSREKVKGILVALDVTEKVLQEATRVGSNVVITHHPLLFRSIKRLDDSTVAQRLVKLAIQKNLQVLSFHTNLDSTHEGLNDLLAKKLGLQKGRALIPSPDPKYPRAGLGRIGSVRKTSLRDFLKQILRALNLKNLRYVGNLDRVVQKVAVMTGSGAEYFPEAKEAGAEVLVTGDVKYHGALDALAEGVAVVDVGHFASEIGMVPLVAEKLRQWSRQKRLGIKVHESTVQEDPFRFWSA